MTETARTLRHIGRPHARARATAALLAGAGAALSAAALGARLAPSLILVFLAWIAVVAALAGSLVLARRASRSAGPAPLAVSAENAAHARSGSVAAVLAPLPAQGASAALFAVADRRAAALIRGAASPLTRDLRRTTLRGLVAGVLAATAGALLFVAADPGAGRAAGFWHPWHALELARAPLGLTVDRERVRRGDTVAVSIRVPGASGGHVTLWSRGPGEGWKAALVALDSSGRATRRVGPLDGDLWVKASSGARRSGVVYVDVATPAFLADVSLQARFPGYLNRADEPLLAGPDTVALPVGTEIVARGTASVPLAAAVWRLTNGTERTPLRAGGRRFEGAFTPMRSGTWVLSLATADGAPLEDRPPALALRLVPDSAPVVGVPVPGHDTTLPFSLVQPLVIDVHDDHGITRLSLVSWRVSQTGKIGEPDRQALEVGGAGDRAIVQAELDAQRRGLLPGDTLRFRVEAWDNAPAAQEGRSAEFALRLPSREELRAAQRDAANDIIAAAESVATAQRQLADKTNDLAQERSRAANDAATSGRQPPAQSGGTLPFQTSERAQELARQQEAVGQRVQELAKAVDELSRAARAAGIDDTAFQARLREVQEMLGRAMTPELEQRLRDLQAALSRLDPDATREALRRLAEAQQQLKETLERSQELFRRAAVEGQLASLAQDAEQLRREQSQWNADESRRPDSAAAAAERALAERAESLAAGIAQANRDLGATDRADAARNASDSAASGTASHPERQARRASGAMQRAATSAEQVDASGAAQQGEMAEQALDSIPEALRARRDSVAGQWRQEALDALDRALSETAALAERQRRLAAGLDSGGSAASARSQQAAIEEGAAAVERQIRAAAGRHALVSPGLQSALGFAQRQMAGARAQLEQAQPNTDGAAQLAGEALDALNVTAYGLAQARADVAGAKSGSGFQEAIERLAQLANQQAALNKDGMGMLPMMGAGGDAMMQQLRSLAARQRALAEQLERLQASGGSNAAGALAQEARDLARQLESGRMDRQTTERQERLYRRLLDAGRTLTGPEPDQDKERTSRAAIGDSVHLPGLLAPGVTAGPRIRYPTWQELEGLSPDERRMVLEYFRLLNAPPNK
ncbi:MAG TPA: hypothetical protein VKB63_02180 [Gemmatimonadales bacterium]|nr:hypothetical protein [Gemmatimonadales bacterium]